MPWYSTEEDHRFTPLPIAGDRRRRLPLAVIRASWPSDKHGSVKILTAGELATTPTTPSPVFLSALRLAR